MVVNLLTHVERDPLYVLSLPKCRYLRHSDIVGLSYVVVLGK